MIGFVPPDDREASLVARRCDWRFLLPDPNPRSVLVRARGLLGAAATATFVTLDSEPPDLVVLESPSDPELTDAFRLLAGGGSVYAEWRGVGALRRRAAERRVRSAGFDAVRVYAARPDPNESLASAWMPIEQTSPAAFLMARPRTRRGLVRDAVSWIRRKLWSAGPRWRLTTPICVVARKPAGNDTQPDVARGYFIDELTREVSRTAATLGIPLGDAPEQLLLTPGGNPLNKLVLLAFPGGSPNPLAAVKMARVERSVESLRREAAALEDLGTRRIEGVPKLLFCEERRGIVVLAESAVSGARVDAELTVESFSSTCTRAAEWLARLAGATRREEGEEGASGYVSSVWASFTDSFGRVLPAETRSHAMSTLARLPPLPSVREQRDFSPWNVMIGDDGELRVLDWESSVARGLPFLDMIYFLTYCAFYLRRPRDYDGFAATYCEAWGGRSALSEAAFRAIRLYAERCGLSSDSLPALRLLTWAVHSASEFARMVDAVGDTPPPEVLRQSLFLRLFIAETELALRNGSGGPA